MRYLFSAAYLKILPPATNFGEAWENLCLSLLRAETSDATFMKLAPPDRGIDIFRQSTNAAYQCKSSESGILGTIEPQGCIESLDRAIQARTDIPWVEYSVALNAPLSGVGFAKISDFVASQGLQKTLVTILPAEYWGDLCDRHTSVVQHLFDYRVFVSEADVLEALRKAKYYDHFVLQAIQHMKDSPLELAVSNNRTPVELVLPFSGELTVEQLLDVVKTILGLTVTWTNFPDLGTSCSPSLSMTVDLIPQPFKLKLSELTHEQRAKLQLWIKLVWRDKLETDREHKDADVQFHFFRSQLLTSASPTSQDARGKTTLDRMESMIQSNIWKLLSKE